jgi:putative nucleotidyltransferase with HDIG domain
MYDALQANRSDHGWLLEVVTLLAFMMLVLGTLYGVARTRFVSRSEGLRDLSAAGLLVVLAVFVAKLVVSGSSGIAELVGNEALPESVWYLAPVAGSAMLARILMGRERARFVTFAAAAACAAMMQFEAVYVLYFFLMGTVASAAVGGTRERIEVLRAGAITGVFGSLMVLLVHFVQLYVGDGELSAAVTIRPLWSMVFAFSSGILSSFLVLAWVPIFEALGFVTDYRMLELASLNHPLMRQLMLRAPGTYHHSVIVGTLAEAACEAIGANGLQAKIAAYFHDIGKALKPNYFVENQRGGVNRHDDLDPITSAHIIISHVTEGARLAREHNLPRPIIDNILMHHGTGLLQFFFAKAQMEADDPAAVDESLFRYPGPRPNTREAGVVMLADKVEAATRTIQRPTEENIRAMINRIINSVMADDQFSECPLTFREIYTIADTFVRVLMGIHHQRIEYPDTRSLSLSGAEASKPRESISGQPGTITLDLDRPPEPEQIAHSGLWNDDSIADEDDYEAVENLPRGEP